MSKHSRPNSRPTRTDKDSIKDIVKALENYGADISCGACMEVAFTGVTTNEHTCPNSKKQVIGTYYLIRHKATGQFMPQGKKNRGYSHWNPGNPNAEELTMALPIPRMLDSKKKAERCIVQWFYMRNSSNDYDGDVKLGKEDGRKMEDLEVVECELVIRGGK